MTLITSASAEGSESFLDDPSVGYDAVQRCHGLMRIISFNGVQVYLVICFLKIFNEV